MNNTAFACDGLKFSRHAIEQMFTRGINPTEVRKCLEQHEIIEDYPEDTPYPSKLLLCFIGARPIHLVIAINELEKTCILVTAYEPDKELWSDDFKKRKML